MVVIPHVKVNARVLVVDVVALVRVIVIKSATIPARDLAMTLVILGVMILAILGVMIHVSVPVQ